MNRLFGQGQTPGPLAGKPLGTLALNKGSRFYKGLVTAVLDGRHCETTKRAATTFTSGPSGTWATALPYDVRQDVTTGTLSAWLYSPTALVVGAGEDAYFSPLNWGFFVSSGNCDNVSPMEQNGTSLTGDWNCFARHNSTPTTLWSPSAAPPLGAFHVAISYVPSGTTVVYYNGAQVASFTAGALATSSSKTLIAGYAGINAPNSIWCLCATHHNYAMSAEQVKALWHPRTRWELVQPVDLSPPMMDAAAAPGATSQNYMTLLGCGC